MFCPDCGKEVSESQAFCQHCGLKLSESVPPEPAASLREKTPWEDREQLGLLSGLLKTVKAVLFSPADFFKKMSVSGGLTDPLLFGLILGMTGCLFHYVWQASLHGVTRSFMSPEIRAASEYSMQGVGLAFLAASTPFVIIFTLFIQTGFLHMCLLMVRGAKSGYEATFRVVAYSGSPFVLMAIPFCGTLIAVIWSMVIITIGLKEAHETTGGRATVAVFLPVILCCGMTMATAVLFMGAIAASLGSMMHP